MSGKSPEKSLKKDIHAERPGVHDSSLPEIRQQLGCGKNRLLQLLAEHGIEHNRVRLALKACGQAVKDIEHGAGLGSGQGLPGLGPAPLRFFGQLGKAFCLAKFLKKGGGDIAGVARGATGQQVHGLCCISLVVTQGRQADAQVGPGVSVRHGKDIDPVQKIGPGRQVFVTAGKGVAHAHVSRNWIMASRSYLPFSCSGIRLIVLSTRGKA